MNNIIIHFSKQVKRTKNASKKFIILMDLVLEMTLSIIKNIQKTLQKSYQMMILLEFYLTLLTIIRLQNQIQLMSLLMIYHRGF